MMQSCYSSDSIEGAYGITKAVSGLVPPVVFQKNGECGNEAKNRPLWSKLTQYDISLRHSL